MRYTADRDVRAARDAIVEQVTNMGRVRQSDLIRAGVYRSDINALVRAERLVRVVVSESDPVPGRATISRRRAYLTIPV